MPDGTAVPLFATWAVMPYRGRLRYFCGSFMLRRCPNPRAAWPLRRPREQLLTANQGDHSR